MIIINYKLPDIIFNSQTKFIVHTKFIAIELYDIFLLKQFADSQII